MVDYSQFIDLRDENLFSDLIVGGKIIFYNKPIVS